MTISMDHETASPAPADIEARLREFLLADEVRNFVFNEAQLADKNRYTEWEALWADDPDCTYWVPASGELDPDTRISYIHDNRSRLKTRIAQLLTGQHYPQTPESKLCRVVSALQVEISDPAEPVIEASAHGTFVLVEYRDVENLWSGDVYYRLRRTSDGWRLLEKRVELVNRDGILPTFAFII